MLLQCCWCLCINRCYTYKVHIPVARYVCYHLLFRLVEVSILRMGLVCYALLASVCGWYAMLYSHPSVVGMLCFTHTRLWLVCYALLTSVCGWYAMLYSHPSVVGILCFTHMGSMFRTIPFVQTYTTNLLEHNLHIHNIDFNDYVTGVIG